MVSDDIVFTIQFWIKSSGKLEELLASPNLFWFSSKNSCYQYAFQSVLNQFQFHYNFIAKLILRGKLEGKRKVLMPAADWWKWFSMKYRCFLFFFFFFFFFFLLLSLAIKIQVDEIVLVRSSNGIIYITKVVAT